MTPLLEFREVTKEYHGVPAVQDVSLSITEGEVHALLGENGAGKSTLTKMAAGVVPITRGKILLAGEELSFSSPADALRKGIAMVFQETSLVPSLTVAQNLYLGDEKAFNRLRPLYIAAQQFLQSLNFPVDPTANVASLGAAQRQMVEIARAVRKNARIIIFDEPTATLTPEEKQHFFELIERLKERGCSVIFISHALEEALAISDRITILRDGKLVITDETGKFDRDSIISAMVGRDLSGELYGGEDGKRRVRPYGKRVLSVQNVSMGRMVRNTSFAAYAGQVTGIFGLIGSGRTETAKIVSGVIKRNFFHGGVTRLGSKSVRYRTPAPSVRDGIAYVTEDRKVEGIFETMSVAESIEIGKLASPSDKSVILRGSEARDLAEHWTKSLNIRAISSDVPVIELSGGNQQKVVIAKALVQDPQLIIFDEPTRGVDVGAIAEIHAVINRLADQGLAVVMISSYLPEILNMSDRILVARKGRIVEEFSGDEATEENIMYAAVH
ncbi:MAG: sugar ABC transporter ATP-binding protein [Phyllobacteriaceae bacterium]|nr:sugar ABC transporter ATP-binding protein [Nitratireductor sp.]MCO5134283.1 sugar ABC transporter ATP-binding protein [Phyllobacteriaceae bacterium]